MTKKKDFRQAFQSPTNLLSDALCNMNQTGFRAVLVVDEEHKLLGLVTDWDIRNALLKGYALDTPLSKVMNPNPVIGQATLPQSEYLKLMIANKIECLPVVDVANHVVGFALLTDYVQEGTASTKECPMVIMAGGEGKRLWPLTKDTPKPLLPIAGRPLLGHILDYVHTQGFQDVLISTHYQAEKIEDFLKTSLPEGITTKILKEETPLGTAGCLKALITETSNNPIFIINGDILTDINFESMYQWHIAHENVLTLACRQYSFKVPYGVLEMDGQQLRSIHEKPEHFYNVNAGVYLVSREALTFIPEGAHFDMTDLINVLLYQGLKVGAYPISESWIDIGKPEDYEKANQEYFQYLPAGVS